MKVVEMFASINGEGPCAGELALFVRFQGCNLRCSYCDTMWANAPDCPYTKQPPEDIVVSRVVVAGAAQPRLRHAFQPLGRRPELGPKATLRDVAGDQYGGRLRLGKTR